MQLHCLLAMQRSGTMLVEAITIGPCGVTAAWKAGNGQRSEDKKTDF